LEPNSNNAQIWCDSCKDLYKRTTCVHALAIKDPDELEIRLEPIKQTKDTRIYNYKAEVDPGDPFRTTKGSTKRKKPRTTKNLASILPQNLKQSQDKSYTAIKESVSSALVAHGTSHVHTITHGPCSIYETPSPSVNHHAHQNANHQQQSYNHCLQQLNGNHKNSQQHQQLQLIHQLQHQQQHQ
jgi:hypothetical protein